jgi:hypothetical protein
MRLSAYVVFSSVVTFIAYTRGVDDYFHQYADNDGDNDLGFLRGIEWGFFALLASVALCVVFEVGYRRITAKDRDN